MKALIVVDVQNDFITGSLAVPKAAEIVPIINQLQEKFKHIIYTQDWHPANHSSFKENGGPWPIHCVEFTSGARFPNDLQIKTNAMIKGEQEAFFLKKGTDTAVDSYSGFYDNEKKHDTGLKGYLDSIKVNEVYIVGLATDYCVKATAIDAIQAGFKTFLVIDACRAVDLNPGDEGKAISDMLKAKVGIIHSIHV